jgi:Holliday junction resolvase RusA-like endonuclease
VRQTIEIPEVMPGLNGSDGLINENRWNKKKRQDRCFGLIKAQKPRKHEGKVIIEYTRASVIAPDWDNLSASFKHWGDALVKAGVIQDDKPTVVLNFYPKWEKAKNHKSAKTIIKIMDIDDVA